MRNFNHQWNKFVGYNDFNQQLSLAANIAPSPNEQTKQTKKGF